MAQSDVIITRKLSVYDEAPFLEMIKLIRSANVAIQILKCFYMTMNLSCMHKSGGTYMRAKLMAKEFVWAGFDMVSQLTITRDYGTQKY